MDATASLLSRLQQHFGSDPAALPLLTQNYSFYERANIHLAIDDLSELADKQPELLGIVQREEYESVSLSKLALPSMVERFEEGPVEFVDEPLPKKQRLSCVKRGLYFFQLDSKPVALLLTNVEHSRTPGIVAEVMALDKEHAELVTQKLTRLVRNGKAFRGHALSLDRDCYGGHIVKFHNLPAVTRDQIILPEVVLNRIERHTIAFSQHAKRLSAAGRHLKRGVLLHGPPGTGKTFSAMYLASRMPDRTVFLLTGAGMGSIESACNMARMLEPATIILEDVDLIGAQRDRQTVDANALLFELLNQMDGLSDDADVLFILTTNRPDVLEAALAARPGRIDQAIEVPLPDEDCRRRLIDLYSEGLELETTLLDEFIQRTEGVSAAFIRELLRKAAVFAAIESEDELVVRNEHIKEALEELLVAGGPLTQSLLGAKQKTSSSTLEAS